MVQQRGARCSAPAPLQLTPPSLSHSSHSAQALYLFFTYSLESASSVVVGLVLQLCLLDLGSVQASVPVLQATPTDACALYTVASQSAFALGAAVLANRLAFANGQ